MPGVQGVGEAFGPQGGLCRMQPTQKEAGKRRRRNNGAGSNNPCLDPRPSGSGDLSR